MKKHRDLRKRVLSRPQPEDDHSDSNVSESDYDSTVSRQGRRMATAGLFEEDFMEFLYKPHTLSGLAAVVLFIAYHAFMVSPEARSELETLRVSLGCVSLTFLVYSCLQSRDSSLVRPHPIFWRFVHGALILYLMLLVYLLMQSVHNARQFMRVYDDSLGVLPEENFKLYAEDCRIYTPDHPESNFAIVRETFDLFSFGHFFGWFWKALIFRDWTLLWILSVFWEVLEITWQHLLPNFKECWWDHWILDVGVCNFLGMWLGMYTCSYLSRRQYNWTGVKEIPTMRGKLKRVAEQFTPFSWASYTWAAFHSYKRMLQVIFILVAMWIAELNAFFLKFVLWVPPHSMLNMWRLTICVFGMFPAVYEFYQYLRPQCKRLGANLWIITIIAAVELMLIVKVSFEDPDMYTPPVGAPEPVPSPQEVLWAWVIFLVVFNLGLILLFFSSDFRKAQGPTTTGKFWRKRLWTYALEVMIVSSVLPLVYLVWRDTTSTFQW
eukprot:Rmarinus@m.23948